ncbi:hypothetical protein PTSG_00984 [Salpingoeca rosetta]|uniref:SH2 domain-containing protein n=1 Tax=Salpingoeca rosetta (strain ATCC 50818 / BSB-021) TaxID=946362 RepID=F2TY22_SALR5|nr:uncharacterized protein PTSG_00984 [Salpingoeca rosetta]EGD76281.1 hypothetical protein PTSG_00984 [Salpingoeca rosetta]|eukprot:XP_004998456.1 hypothetical protein PTSG_00984 [Salpingoeca rosetta]
MAMVTPVVEKDKHMVPPQDLVQPSTSTDQGREQQRDDDLARMLKLRMTDPELQATAQPLSDQITDSVVDMVTLAAPWYHGRRPRHSVNFALTPETKEAGSFAIRKVGDAVHDGFQLHLKTDEAILERHIEVTANETVRLEGTTAEYETLSQLVAAYSDGSESEGALPFPLLNPVRMRANTFGNTDASTAGPAPDDDGITHAADGEPWKIADVCDWLEDLGLSKYTPAFRDRGIDGVRLLNIDHLDLQQMGVDPHDARAIMRNVAALKAQTVEVSSETPSWVRRTLVVKELDGELRLFDAASGEEVYQLAHEIARQLNFAPPSSATTIKSSIADDEDDETEFAWVGDTKGWVRRGNSGRKLYEGDWSVDDMCAWLQHVNLDVCVPIFKQRRLTPSRFKALDPEQQAAIGEESGVGNALVEAWRLFNLRVFANMTAARPNGSAHQAPSAFPGMPFVDEFARVSPWCRIDEPSDKVAASLMDYAPAGGFAVVRHPEDDDTLQLLVVVPPFGLTPYNILVDDDRVRLESTRYLCRDLSELVHIFASDNDEKAWLLNLETPTDDYLSRPWFSDTLTPDTAAALVENQHVGSFVVFPSQFEDVFTLVYVSTEGVVEKNILSRNEGYQLEGGSHQVFPTLTDLVNHYTFVRMNDLGTMLLQDPADFQATHRHEHAPWFRPLMTRQDAEAVLAGLADGAFVVRKCEHNNATFALSYIFDGQVRHRLIDQDSEGITFFRESTRAFKSLYELVAAYSADHLDDIPCRLLNHIEAAQPPLSAASQQQQEATFAPDTTPAAATTAQPAPLDPIYGHGSFPWLQLSPVTKAQALASLAGKPDGAFVVRSSERAPTFLSLSYVFGDHIYHELIGLLNAETDGDSGVYLLSVPDRIFETIYDLVTYYKLNAGELHCPLVETDTAPAPAFIRERAAWLVLGLPRDEAVSLLEGKPTGTFIIRESQSSSAHLVLCLVDPTNTIVQEYIEMGDHGVYLEKNPDACFPTLHGLVQHYSQPQPELPCPLVVYDTPLWAASTRSLSDTFVSARPRQEERLTLESQHAASMRARTRPELFRDDDARFFVQHADDRSAELTAMRSDRTLKWRSFTDNTLPLVGTVQSSREMRRHQQQQQQQRHQKHTHRRTRQHHANGSRTFDDNLFGNREDAVKRTCRQLGLYTDPTSQSWMCIKQPLADVRHLLRHQGDFVVHKSAHGNYACLTMQHEGNAVSFEMVRRNGGLGLLDSRETFDRLTRLIEHYVHPAQTDLPASLGPNSM